MSYDEEMPLQALYSCLMVSNKLDLLMTKYYRVLEIGPPSRMKLANHTTRLQSVNLILKALQRTKNLIKIVNNCNFN